MVDARLMYEPIFRPEAMTHRWFHIIEGLPVLVVAFLFELLVVITVIRPKSKCALNLSGRDEKPKIA
jgi:hypothetical protein